MTRRVFVVLVTLVALPFSVPSVVAQPVLAGSGGMRGLTGIEIVVEDLIPEASLDGLTKNDLVEAVENRLRQAGVTLTPDAIGGAYLYVNVNMTTGSGIYIYCADVELRQAARLVRVPDQVIREAVTWQTGMVGAVQAAELRVGITSVVLGEIDTFIQNYGEENPGSVTIPPDSSSRPPA